MYVYLGYLSSTSKYYVTYSSQKNTESWVFSLPSPTIMLLGLHNLSARTSPCVLSRAFSVSIPNPSKRRLMLRGLPVASFDEATAKNQLNTVVNTLGKFGTVVSAYRSQYNHFCLVLVDTRSNIMS